MSAPRPPLASLQQRARAATTDAERLALAREIRRDPRAGAKALAEALKRRCARAAVEAARMEALFARTRALRAAGVQLVAGVDEVGMGPLAGPVVAAAVILRDDAVLPELDDSKRLDPAVRVALDAAIRAQAVALHVVEVDVPDVDRLNVYRAGLEALRRAVLGLAPAPAHVLVDARRIPDCAIPQTAVVHGDGLEAPIAAASIVAKVHRDRLMERLDAEHPGYGFARHKGYATPDHLAALRRLGPCALHRRSFAPVAERS